VSEAGELAVLVEGREVGRLSATPSGECRFRYAHAASERDFVALTMPVREAEYLWPALMPVFAALTPRGAYGAELARLAASAERSGALAVLSLALPRAGRLAVPPPQELPPLSREAILAASDSRERLRQGLEAQLPLPLPRRLSTAVLHDGSLAASDATGRFRAAPSDCPEWAYNASVCQRIAERAGIDSLPLELARDRMCLAGPALAPERAVEDLAGLMGLALDARYGASAERMVSAAAAFVAPVGRIGLRRELFRRIALAAILRDGSQHLGRVALEHGGGSVRLAPLALALTTSVYPWYGPARLALSVGGSREYRRRRGSWRQFGAHCALADRESLAIIEWLTDALYSELPALEAEAKADEGRLRMLAALKSEWIDAAQELKAGW
jgi:HipA-like protein